MILWVADRSQRRAAPERASRCLKLTPSYPMAGTAPGAIGGKAVVGAGEGYGARREALPQGVFWRRNAVVLLNEVCRCNLANRQELGQGRPRRGPGR